jgi:hypothetical protein
VIIGTGIVRNKLNRIGVSLVLFRIRKRWNFGGLSVNILRRNTK